MQHGPQLIKLASDLLGADLLSQLQFIPDHVKLDVAHSKFNEKLMQKALHDIPNALEPLVEAGQKALHIYQNYLKDCITQSNQLP